VPRSSRLFATRQASSAGTASEAPRPSPVVIIPSTFPRASMRDPPENPGYGVASVWMYRSSLGPRQVRIGPPTELTTPREALGPSPRPGLPTASASWPIRGSPSAGVAVSRSKPSTCSTARSVEGSRPTNRAGSVRPSLVPTARSSSRSSAWLAVNTIFGA
jgi:hypothetical protein